MRGVKCSAICSLLLVVLLSGCGKEAPMEVAKEPVIVVDEPSILPAYQDILKAAPALKGEHEELLDLSFDYDENFNKFGNHIECYAIYDINKDEIPELITLSTVNMRWAPISVYIGINGKAVLVKNPQEMEAHGTFEQSSLANGAYSTYFCDDNHIHSVWRGTDIEGNPVEENSAYILEGDKLILTDCAISEENGTSFSDIAKAND